ncbi:MAG: tRNA threonylcarbamoyladenosine dehydratase, partial [Clostridia bacterium]|nr:tRNA threonylcarbamoyladenosine dehydratase [Clostridia bacterium]
MKEQFIRTSYVLGADAVNLLGTKKVAVFGLGGVGGHCVDALCRSGIGKILLVDGDTVAESNLNRQFFARKSTVGRYKTEVAAEHIADINPNCKVTVKTCFFTPENADDFDFSEYDYIVDAIDSVKCKTKLIVKATKESIPIISSMGAGNKLDPTAFKVADIYKTKVCPLAKVMRHELKKRGVKKLKTVYSEEIPTKRSENKENVPGSTAFC